MPAAGWGKTFSALFIVIGPPESEECAIFMAILDRVFRILHVPIAEHKRDGRIVFLGIEIDTLAGELRLPTEKLQKLRSLLQAWGVFPEGIRVSDWLP